MKLTIGWGRLPQEGKGSLPLLVDVLLRGMDATVLKGLQEFGALHPVRGENPISFCNLFFLAQLALAAFLGLLLQVWWVVGVIGLYALTLPLGRELALRLAYRRVSVAQVSPGSSLAIVVSVLSAAVVLGEPLRGASLAGSALVLTGVLAGSWRWPIRSGPTSVLLPATPDPMTPWP